MANSPKKRTIDCLTKPSYVSPKQRTDGGLEDEAVAWRRATAKNPFTSLPSRKKLVTPVCNRGRPRKGLS